MPRYAAFLRGVMPTNCSMADLERAFESAGFAQVRTYLAGGNVTFDATKSASAALEKRAEKAIEKITGLGKEQTTRIWDTVTKVATR